MLKAVELLLGQGAALGNGGEPARQILVVGVALRLLLRHWHKKGLDRAAGEFLFDVALAPAQHDSGKAAMHRIEIAVAGRAAALVELVEIAVEAEQRPEDFRI